MKTTPSFGSLAAAAALSALFGAFNAAGAPTGSSDSAGDTVHCYGVHSCKGNSDCKTTETPAKAIASKP